LPTYRLHDTTGDDLGLVEHPASNVEPGDVVMLDDGRETLVTARVETGGGELAALLEVVLAPEEFATLPRHRAATRKPALARRHLSARPGLVSFIRQNTTPWRASCRSRGVTAFMQPPGPQLKAR